MMYQNTAALPPFSMPFSFKPFVLPAGVFEQFCVEFLLNAEPLLSQVHGRQRDVSAVRVEHQARVMRVQQLHRGRERRNETRNHRSNSPGSGRDISARFLRYCWHIWGFCDGFRRTVLLSPVRHAEHMWRSTWCVCSCVYCLAAKCSEWCVTTSGEEENYIHIHK